MLICDICNKQYSSKSSLYRHKNTIHRDIILAQQKKYYCKYCNNPYKYKQSKWAHQQICTKKLISTLEPTIIINETCIESNKLNDIKDSSINSNNTIEELKNQITELSTIQKIILKKLKLSPESVNNTEITDKEKKIELSLESVNNTKITDKEKKGNLKDILESKLNYPINNQLIDIIINKSNIIEKLKSKLDYEVKVLPEISKNQATLAVNNVIIISREDNYINATQLCIAGNKKFNDWYRLSSTEQLLIDIEREMGIPVSQLVDIKKETTTEYEQSYWIHSALAIQLAQWISSEIALKVSNWIRNLLLTGTVSLDTEMKGKIKEIELKDEKIKLLEDAYIKKQTRKDYPYKNVIYILSTLENKKNRIYIIGKSTDLKNRLSTYNKTTEHEVIYYKGCDSYENMNTIEHIVLNKLNVYREKANRDRFILPVDKEINFFINIINQSVNFIVSS